jgi:hypothetical protein
VTIIVPVCLLTGVIGVVELERLLGQRKHSVMTKTAREERDSDREVIGLKWD